MHRQRSLKVNYFLNSIKTISSLVFPLISFAYASRILSVEGIGKVDFSKSIVAYFTMFATLGVSSYGIREGAKIRDEKAKFSKFVKELFVINILSTLAVYIIFIFTILFVSKFEEYRYLLLINGLSIGFTALGLDWLYGAQEDYLYITVRSIIFQLLSLLLLIIFVRTRNDYYKYAGIVVFSNVGSNIFNFINARKYVDLNVKEHLDIKRHLKQIFIFFANTMVGNIYVTLDTSMVGLLSTEYAVGLYSASNKLNRICVSLITALSTVMLPRMSYYIEHRSMKQYDDLLAKSLKFTIMISLPISVGLFMLSKDILLLVSGKDYINAYNCSLILSSIVFIIPLSTFFSHQIINPYRKEKIQLFITIIGTIINIILNVALIPKFYEIGAAIGTVLSELSVLLLLVFFSRKIHKSVITGKAIIKYFISVVPLVCVVVVIGQFTEGIVKCILSVVCGATVYFTLLYILREEIVLNMIKMIKASLDRNEDRLLDSK